MALLIASAVLNYRHRQAELAGQPQRIELVPADASAPATPAPVSAMPGESPARTGTMPDGSLDLRGRMAPNFTLKDIHGDKVTLSGLRGKAVLINFWATWCAPCKIEIPWFIRLYQQYQPQGLVILGVDAENAPQDEVTRSAKELGINYPVLLRGDTIGDQWGGLDGLPMSFYIDRDGKIVDQTVGLYSRDEVEARIRKILAAGPQLPQTQTAQAQPAQSQPAQSPAQAAKP